jgi:Bacterial Ig domain
LSREVDREVRAVRRPQRAAVGVGIVGALCLLLVQLAPGYVAPTLAAAAEPLPVRELRSIPTAQYGAARPAGLAALEDGSLLVAHERSGRTGLLHLSPAEDLLGVAELPALSDPDTLAFDPARDRLVALDGGDALAVTDADVRTTQPATTRIDANVQVADPRGATFDPVTGAWFVLDGGTGTIVRAPTAAGAPRSPSRIAVPALRGQRVQGLALNPRDGLFHVANPDAGLLYALDQSGAIRATHSLSSLDVRDLRAMVFAPSADPTDDPGAVSLYIADAGDATTLGRVVESTLTAQAAVASSDAATLVQTLHVSQFNPPSPDPAGITYMPAADRLEVVDSEVDEMPIFQGVNLFQITRGGQLADTGVTQPYANEPTGAGFNPADGTLFISDDNANRVFAVRPGADGRYGTPDDPRTSINTTVFGSQDAEGTEFDPVTGHVLVVDGVAREVYDVNPVNGVFGDADDVTTHFDLEQYGVLDPEGIGVDTSRNSVVVLDRAGRKVYEVTRAGALIRVIDLQPIASRNPAGITVAPGSGGGTSYWIADRGVDNNTDPNENDGKAYEVRVTSVDSPPSVAITGPAGGATVTGTVTVQASATDDQGVTQVRFRVDSTTVGTDTNGADGWSVAWNTSSVTDGSHTLSAIATDTGGNTAPSPGVTVTVANSGEVTSQDVAIAAGLDDVEERSNGRMWVATTDLDLVVDGTVSQTVGLRFAGIGAPRGAQILNAYVQFQVDDVSTGPANLVVRAHASDNAPAFTLARFDVTSRPTTTAATTWVPATWPAVGARGADQRTTDLAPVLQQVVDRPGWSAGGALALIVTGSGSRVAESFEGTFAPVLHIEYRAA